MFGGGKSMGGSGGGMLRTYGRLVTTRTGVTNLQEPISSSSSSTTPTSPKSSSRSTQNKQTTNSNQNLSISTPLTYYNNLPVSPTSGVPVWPYFGAASASASFDDWVYVDESDDDGFMSSHGFDDFVLGPVPSVDEVNSAVSALQQVFDPAAYPHVVRDRFTSNLEQEVVVDQISASSSLGHRVASFRSELDWIEPSPFLSNPRMLQPYANDRVYDAFYLLQTEPSIQKMVVSLASDRDVWNAVLKNKAVRELKESFNAGAAEANASDSSSDGTTDDSNPAMDIVKRIFSSTKAKLMEVIETITNIVNELFRPPVDEKATNGAAKAGTKDPFQENLRTSFLLSIVVLLVVVVTRASKA